MSVCVWVPWADRAMRNYGRGPDCGLHSNFLFAHCLSDDGLYERFTSLPLVPLKLVQSLRCWDEVGGKLQGRAVVRWTGEFAVSSFCFFVFFRSQHTTQTAFEPASPTQRSPRDPVSQRAREICSQNPTGTERASRRKRREAGCRCLV